MSAKPYELMVRFRPDGSPAGAHIRTLTTVNGRDFESDPQPLADATDPVFENFAKQFSAAAVAERDAAVAARDTAVAERDAAVSARDTAVAEVERLTRELEALRNPTDTNGFPVLTAVQLRLAILTAGLDVDATIAAIPDAQQRVRVETYWQYATSFERSHPLIAGMVQLLGLTDADADTLWRTAGSIQ